MAASEYDCGQNGPPNLEGQRDREADPAGAKAVAFRERTTRPMSTRLDHAADTVAAHSGDALLRDALLGYPPNG